MQLDLECLKKIVVTLFAFPLLIYSSRQLESTLDYLGLGAPDVSTHSCTNLVPEALPST